MKQKTKIIRPGYRIISSDIDGFDSLADSALDLRCSWNHEADEIWHQLDPDLWESARNPWLVLQTVSRDQFKKTMANPLFRKKVEELIQSKENAITGPAWFQRNFSKSHLTCVAFFSMEFMLSESLPIYSGGLGNVAGDQLKAASDLGVPVIGVGLLYKQGYFRQVIDKNGEQQALFPFNDPGQLPVIPLRHSNGEWLRLEIELPGYSVWLRAWQVQVGRIILYLLDSNDAANYPAFVQVELFADGVNGELPIILAMKRETESEATTRAYYYYASVSSERPASDYTPRIITDIPGVSVPLETTLILWQR